MCVCVCVCVGGNFRHVCEHGVVVGMHIMPTAEGARHVFGSLLRLYPQDELPQYVVYDDSCHLRDFCMSREPKYFESKLLLVLLLLLLLVVV